MGYNYLYFSMGTCSSRYSSGVYGTNLHHVTIFWAACWAFGGDFSKDKILAFFPEKNRAGTMKKYWLVGKGENDEKVDGRWKYFSKDGLVF